MKNLNYLLLLLLTIGLYSCKKDVMLPPPDNGAPFEKAIGGTGDDIANSIIYSDGYLMVLGTTGSFGDEGGDIYLVKMDLNGNVVWEKTYGGSYREDGLRIIETSDGDYMIIGTVRNNSIYMDFYVARVNKKGDLLWEKNYGGDLDEVATDIIELADGNFLITGGTVSYGAGSLDMILLKIDGSGNQIFQREYGGTDIDMGARFAKTNNSDVMVVGFTSSFGAGDRDWYLLRLNTNGDTLFTKTYGGSGYEEPKAIVRLHNGNYLLHGHDANIDFAHNMKSFVVTPSGELVWELETGGTQHDGGQAAMQDSHNNLVLIGESSSFGNDRQIYFVKADMNGQVITEKAIGGIADEEPFDVIEAGESYFIVGKTNSMGNGGYDMYIVKERK